MHEHQSPPEPSIQPPSDEPAVRHKRCPSCGHKKFKGAKTRVPLADHGLAAKVPIPDRVCKKCGTVYHPLMPGWVGAVPILMGVCAFGMILLSMNDEMVGTKLTWFGMLIVFVLGILCFITGIQLLIKRPKSNHPGD